MRETFEFRLLERYAKDLLPPSVGRVVSGGTIRIVEFDANDSRLLDLARLKQRLNQEQDESPFYGWRLKHRLTKQSLDEAPFLQLTDMAVFEPAGEECGTTYDGSHNCAHCGFGRTQVGPLRLDTRKAPSRSDLAKTIGGEIIVSAAFAASFGKNELVGATFGPIERPSGSIDTRWQQLRIGAAFDVSNSTKPGISPIEEDEAGCFVCPQGHVLGLNQLASLWIRGLPSDCDIALGRQAFGLREGLLNPESPIVVSRRFRAWVRRAEFRGARFAPVNVE